MDYLVYCSGCRREMIVNDPIDDYDLLSRSIGKCSHQHNNQISFDEFEINGLDDNKNSCRCAECHIYDLDNKDQLIECVRDGCGYCKESFREVKEALIKHGLIHKIEYTWWDSMEIGSFGDICATSYIYHGKDMGTVAYDTGSLHEDNKQEEETSYDDIDTYDEYGDTDDIFEREPSEMEF